jgi:hypothetical protein
MSDDEVVHDSELQAKQSVEQAIVAIYDAAYEHALDLTPMIRRSIRSVMRCTFTWRSA